MKLESELEKLFTGYAAPVLWKDGTPPEFPTELCSTSALERRNSAGIPDSRRTAETRLMSLKNHCSRNPEYAKKF
jgi:hypothetical protein